jgi:stress response protein YsnF
VEMAKKPSEIKASETIKKKKKMTMTTNKNNNCDEPLPREEKPVQIVNTVPILAEKFSFSKKTNIENVKVEKKWNTSTKKIEVPVYFEEVYINGKDLKSYGKDDDIISELNKRIIKSFDDMDDTQKKQYSILEKNESKREVVPLFDDSHDRNNRHDINYNDTKKVIPIFGEEIVVSKRIVKLGELILAKNKVTENKKISIDTIKEKAVIRYPDGSTEML